VFEGKAAWIFLIYIWFIISGLLMVFYYQYITQHLHPSILLCSLTLLPQDQVLGLQGRYAPYTEIGISTKLTLNHICYCIHVKHYNTNNYVFLCFILLKVVVLV
jgi:hypothetical protein